MSVHFTGDALTRFFVQVVAIITLSRLLGAFAQRLRQPMVVAEITAGILLGPSLLGRLHPRLASSIFPVESLGLLHLVSQVGLVLFMFVVGLELDLTLLRGRARAAIAISHASIVLPFALGGLCAVPLYAWSEPGVPMLTFALFLCTAMSVTAFPVLARILLERKLLHTRLGSVAMACAAVDDVTAWCILAFVLASARAKNFMAAGLTSVLALVYVGVMLAAVGPLVRRLGQRKVVSHNLVAVVIVLLFVSSLTTELIGIHALFGAFVFGSVLPKHAGFAEKLADRIKDLVVVVLLPLFFAYSGVRTQLGLLDSSRAWLTCGLVIGVACCGKFGGSAVAARLTGMSWREAGALGVLMNTRGLMELIVLNVGLDLGVISPIQFTMLVIMALVTTFMTTPLLQLLYPQAVFASDKAPEHRLSDSEAVMPELLG